MLVGSMLHMLGVCWDPKRQVLELPPFPKFSWAGNVADEYGLLRGTSLRAGGPGQGLKPVPASHQPRLDRAFTAHL